MSTQHDIASASDEACRLYYEKTPAEERIAKGLSDSMSRASKAAVKEKRSDYDKMIAIANPKHGLQFLAKVLSAKHTFFHALDNFSFLFIFTSFSSFTFTAIPCQLQINAHWSAKVKPEMTAEKLQKISTTVVQPHCWVRWLKWWNSSDISREALHFPPPGFTDATLESWLPRAAF